MIAARWIIEIELPDDLTDLEYDLALDDLAIDIDVDVVEGYVLRRISHLLDYHRIKVSVQDG